MKIFYQILLFGSFYVLSLSAIAEDLCLTQDKECAPRGKDETDKSFCERIAKAKTANNPGYEKSYCRFDNYGRLVGFSIRYIPIDERKAAEKSAALSIPGATTIEGALSPGMQAALNETSMGRPIAETMGGVVKLGILDAKDKLETVNVNLVECLPEGSLTIPKNANAGWIALETLNHAITSAGLLGPEISRAERAQGIKNEITKSQITMPLRPLSPTKEIKPAEKNVEATGNVKFKISKPVDNFEVKYSSRPNFEKADFNAKKDIFDQLTIGDDIRYFNHKLQESKMTYMGVKNGVKIFLAPGSSNGFHSAGTPQDFIKITAGHVPLFIAKTQVPKGSKPMTPVTLHSKRDSLLVDGKKIEFPVKVILDDNKHVDRMGPIRDFNADPKKPVNEVVVLGPTEFYNSALGRFEPGLVVLMPNSMRPRTIRLMPDSNGISTPLFTIPDHKGAGQY